MGLGARFYAWLKSLDFYTAIKKYHDGYLKRNKAVAAEATKQINAAIANGQIGTAALIWAATEAYILFGEWSFSPQQVVPYNEEITAEIDKFKDNPQGYLRDKLHAFGTSNETKLFTEFVGTIITEPVVSLLETYAADPDPDPHAMARSFHGIASGLPWAAETTDSLLRVVLGERAPQVGKNIMALYWGLGLGFLGWQTLAPLLSSGLQPNLERYYNKLYRPQRFNANQMRDLFALGKMSAGDFQTTMREVGWRDSDIQKWLELSYRELSEGVIWDLFHQGLMSQGEAEARLRALGYNPKDLPLLFKANEKEDTQDAPKILVSTLKSAFKNKKISADEFRSSMKSLKYADREIELQLQLLTMEKEEDERDLTTGQIKQLYEQRIIGKDEVLNALTGLRYRPDVAQQLIKAWDNEALPKAARINKGTILEGFVNGALSRAEAKKLLTTECGYSDKNAELILKIEEATIAKQSENAGTEGTAVSLDLLSQFAQSGLITRAQMEQRAELARFTTVDRNRIVTLMFTAPVEEPPQLGPQVLFDAFRRGIITLEILRTRLIALGLTEADANLLIATEQAELSPSLLADAYVFGVIERTDLQSRLRGTGLSDEDIEIFIRTIELENPAVFGEFTATFIKRPSVGSLQLALQRELIDEAAFRARLSEQGYNQDAIEIYLFNAQYQAPAQPKQLSKADILSLYQGQKFSRSQALQRLIQIGYTIEDAGLLVEQREVAPEDTEIGQAYIAGFVDQFGTAAALTELDFTIEEIDNFFTKVELGEF